MRLGPTAAWAAPYIGLPWKERGRDRAGVDCWGLARLIAAECLGLDLPAFDERYETTSDRDALARIIAGEMVPWRPVDPPAAARPGDFALLRILGQPVHVGVIAGWPWMVHIEEGIDACVERLDTPIWRRRLVGVFRHESLFP